MMSGSGVIFPPCKLKEVSLVRELLAETKMLLVIFNSMFFYSNKF